MFRFYFRFLLYDGFVLKLHHTVVIVIFQPKTRGCCGGGGGRGGAYSVFLSPICNLLTKATKENQSYLYFVAIDLDLTT